MRSESFTRLEGKEYETAIAALLAAGHDPAEFALEEQRTVLQMAGAAPQVFKLVSIKRLTAGMFRTYNSGRGGTWPFAFERDLRCGVFGSLRDDRGPAMRNSPSRRSSTRGG